MFAYSLVLVGLVTGLQMVYYGAGRKSPMRMGGRLIAASTLTAAGTIFSVAGVLAAAVIIVELLAGAAGTDLRAELLATVLIPPIVVLYHVWEQHRHN